MSAYHTEHHEAADEILRQIGHLAKAISRFESKAAEELEAVKEKYSTEISILKGNLKAKEKALISLAKSNREKLFDGRDRVDLSHGALIFSKEQRVKHARGVLEKLKEQGVKEPAIKVVESVNWDELEGWPDERLIMVGTERVPKEEFNYEVFDKV